MTEAMTRDEIMETPAGRPLDLLVAAVVMKIMPCRCWLSLNTGPNGECESCSRPTVFYSADISKAWRVVEKMQADDGLESEFYGNLIDHCNLIHLKAANAAAAICRAALLTVTQTD